MNLTSTSRPACKGRFLAPFLIALVSLLPWLMHGLRGPFSDATLWLKTTTALYGLMDVQWYEILFTEGLTIFISPLLFFVKTPLFFQLASLIFALFSVLVGLSCYYILRLVLRSPAIAFIVGLLIAFHPFLHQLQYYWMKEFVYIGFLIPGLYLFGRALADDNVRTMAGAAALFFLAVLMRSQATVVFPAALLVTIAWTGFSAWKGGVFSPRSLLTKIAILIALPLAMSVPFRLLNYVHHGTFLMNKTLGWNIGWYTAENKAFNPANGPASQQLADWSHDILGHQTTLLQGLDELAIRSVLASASAVTGNQMYYTSPKYIYYAINRDWKKADDFVVAVFKESVRAEPKRYAAWAYPRIKWYFGGLSENPLEWQPAFAPAQIEKETPYQLELKTGPVKVQAVPGFASYHAFQWLHPTYNALRTAFHRSMTILKKVTFLAIPFILFFLYRGSSPAVFLFALTMATVHIATGLALGLIVGFHHRFSVPLEVFNLFYLGFILDLAARRFCRAKTALPGFATFSPPKK